MSTFPSLLEWFKTTTDKIRNPDLIQDGDAFTFVIGNESCDLDSFISSTLYAYACECIKYDTNLLSGGDDGSSTIVPAWIKACYGLEHNDNQDNLKWFKTSHHFVPLIPISVDQFEIRSLPTRFAELLGVKDYIVTIQDLTTFKFFEKIEFLEVTEENRNWPSSGRGSRVPSNNRASFVLVDHNTPTAAHKALIEKYKSPLQTVAIIDHHVDVNDRSFNVIHGCSVMAQNPRIIEVCASCTSLVVNLINKVITTTKVKTGITLSHVLPTLFSLTTLPYISTNPPLDYQELLVTPFSPGAALLGPTDEPSVLPGEQPTPKITIADAVLCTILVDSVGLESSKGKRTQIDDDAVTSLGYNELFSLNDSTIDPQSLVHQAFITLRALLEDTRLLSINQLLMLDPKSVIIPFNTGSSTDTLSILFAAMPITMQSLLDNARRTNKPPKRSKNITKTKPLSPKPIQIAQNLIESLQDQHKKNGYDVILFCSYYQTPNDNVLQREIMISIPTRCDSKLYDGKKFAKYLKDALISDEQLGAKEFPLTEFNANHIDGLYQQVQEFGEANGIAIEILKQYNSTLSRKYLLPMLSKVLSEYKNE